jgi:hypothetical protein
MGEDDDEPVVAPVANSNAEPAKKAEDEPEA